MKIMTVLGTRPEIIRLSRIIPKLDKQCEHTLVHTGQNYDRNLSAIFFEELGIRKPNVYLGAKGSFAEQIATIMIEVEQLLIKDRPDKILILGDTNSGISAFVAERFGIPVYHMEAGNRCFDTRVPEEINRRLIDHVSSYNFPYVPNSRENLIREGIDKAKITMSGNPIFEVLQYYKKKIEESNILNKLKLDKKRYFLSTFHRQETVNYKERLEQIIKGLELIALQYKLPVVCSIHPRTKSKLDRWDIKSNKLIFLEPLGFFDFAKLEKNALCMISDSGTCCEEGTILRTPTIVCRDTTERPETIEVGSAILSKVNGNNIVKCVEIMLSQPTNWKMPAGYTDNNVSNKIIKYLLGGK